MRPINPYASNQQPAPLSNMIKGYIFDVAKIQVLEVVRKRSLTDLTDFYWNYVYSKELSSQDVQLIIDSNLN